MISERIREMRQLVIGRVRVPQEGEVEPTQAMAR